ncbi:hypothetical protein ABIB40_001316 [Pedobacter sp. UYP30]|uniref:hypothetical protein n=1 Tax=Pedobacter sp. UYP30 TaxID=1756400 RepID=UPI0033955A2A
MPEKSYLVCSVLPHKPVNKQVNKFAIADWNLMKRKCLERKCLQTLKAVPAIRFTSLRCVPATVCTRYKGGVGNLGFRHAAFLERDGEQNYIEY